MLCAQPEASVEDIARAAGVTRQTVYAHFPSREALLNAVVERATAEVTAAFEAAGLDEAPPAVALTQLLDAGWRWLLAASLALGRAAEEQVKAGRMTIDEATHAVHHSFLRLLGVHDPGPR